MDIQPAFNQFGSASASATRLMLCHGFIMMDAMELKTVRLAIPENGNIIVGQSHFIKTVEDIYEAIVNTVPQMKFGIAFNEASGACLTRMDGNDEALIANATANATQLAAGHVFVLSMTDGYPINILGRIRDIPEICTIFVPRRIL